MARTKAVKIDHIGQLVGSAALEMWRARDGREVRLTWRFPDASDCPAQPLEYPSLFAVAGVLSEAGLYFTIGRSRADRWRPGKPLEADADIHCGPIRVVVYPKAREARPCAQVELQVGLPRPADLDGGIRRLIRSRQDALWLCVVDHLTDSIIDQLLVEIRGAARSAVFEDEVVAYRGLSLGVIALDPRLALTTTIPMCGDRDADLRALERATETRALGNSGIWTALEYVAGVAKAVEEPLGCPVPVSVVHHISGMVTEVGADFSLVYCPGLARDSYLLLHIEGPTRYTLTHFGREGAKSLRPCSSWKELLDDYAEREVPLDDDYVPAARYVQYWRQVILEANQTL